MVMDVMFKASLKRYFSATNHPSFPIIMSWHATDETLLYEALKTSRSGLSTSEVEKRQQEYGLNVLPEAKPPTLLQVVLGQFKSPIIYVLLIAGTVSLFIHEVVDAMFIYGVLVLNALIGTIQEWKAEQNAASLQKLLKIQAHVIRGGTEEAVPADELVPGDVVVTESGSRVPADIRLVGAYRLMVDESLLTGESTMVSKNDDLLTEEVPVSDRKNMLFAGSTVMSGRGLGVVVETGVNTEVGKIAKAVATATAAKPPLVIRMERFARQISLIVLVAVLLLAVIGFMKGMEVRELFFMSVALAVSAIPEGLPVAITVALSIATSRMAQKNVIIRKLTAVEALGSVTSIASDKTGTLTVNKQTIKQIALPGNKIFSVSGEGYNSDGDVLREDNVPPSPQEKQLLEKLTENAILCSEGSLFEQDDQWKYSGDAMDLAVYALGYKLGLIPSELKGQAEIAGEIPYESVQKFAAAIVEKPGREGQEERELELVIKGAFEVIIDLCDRAVTAEGEVVIIPKALKEQARLLVEKGYRVLAVASGPVDEVVSVEDIKPDKLQSLSFQGLLGFVDPLRPEVKNAVIDCQRAGVRVSMVTGDHPVTALGIARELNITKGDEQPVTGQDIAAYTAADDPAFSELISRSNVFARVSPLQKLQLVQGLKCAGNFVAVTGDGVNDVPALKEAHIGLAMGSGTDLAKDTASIIIADDNFETIKTGIEQGRYAYDNIRKVTYLLISTGGAEVVLFMLALIFGLPVPLLPVQLLWLNLVTNGIQDVALAFEGGEEASMKKPPRKPSEGIFNNQMISQVSVSALTIGLLSFATWDYLMGAGYEIHQARNLLLLLMVLLENVHVFNCRSEERSAFKVPLSRNTILIMGVLAAQGIHILCMYIPFMEKLLDVNPITSEQWGSLFALSLILLVVMEIFKWIRKRMASK